MKLEAGEAIEVGHNHIIKRPRLTRLLDETNAQIILLVAPAGYGKTTLAREWLADRPHGWYRGSTATADVAALALGLAKSASEIVPGVGERMRAYLRSAATATPSVEALSDRLAEDLLPWPSDAWLVFDDYQFACDSAEAERFAELLLMSSDVRCLVASRTRPTWACARRLLYGEIVELGRNLMAMTSSEAYDVLANFGTDESKGLIALADGWPALLGLAALGEQLELPATALPEHLSAYFAEELYDGAPALIQKGLRQLALVPTPVGQLAELVTEDADTILEHAITRGFFSATSQNRLEFHPLLRSFLISMFVECNDDPDGVLVAGLTRTLIERGEWDDAFGLITQFFNAELLVALFEAALPRLVDHARLPTLARWVEVATDREVESPVIDLASAEIALKEGHFVRSEALAVEAARGFSRRHAFKSKALWLAGTSANLQMRPGASFAYFQRATDTARLESDRRQGLWGQFIAAVTLDDLDAATSLMAELESKHESSIDHRLRTATGRLMMSSLTGQVGDTLDFVDTLAPLASKARDPLVRTSFHNVHAALLILGGRYEDARAAAETELALAVAYGLDFALSHAHFELASAMFGLRLFQTSRAHLRRAASLAAEADDAFLLTNINGVLARTHLATGNTTRALELFERNLDTRASESAIAEYLAWWSLAHAAAGGEKLASSLLSRAAQMSQRIEVSALVPWTRAILGLTRVRPPRRAIEEAFEGALRTGNIDALVTAYRVCPRLLEVLSTHPTYLDRLRPVLDRSKDHSLAESVGIRLPSEHVRLGGLSKREIEVLSYVSQGLSNKDIGKALFITETTVKVHVRNICRKLDVRTRTEAAMRAVELGT